MIIYIHYIMVTFPILQFYEVPYFYFNCSQPAVFPTPGHLFTGLLLIISFCYPIDNLNEIGKVVHLHSHPHLILLQASVHVQD